MNVRSFFFPAVIVLMSLAAQAQAVEMPLYETGPSQDAAFVRFVNARSAPMEVKAGGGSQTGTTLQPSQPVSPFYTVRGNASAIGQHARVRHRYAATPHRRIDASMAMLSAIATAVPVKAPRSTSKGWTNSEPWVAMSR